MTAYGMSRHYGPDARIAASLNPSVPYYEYDRRPVEMWIKASFVWLYLHNTKMGVLSSVRVCVCEFVRRLFCSCAVLLNAFSSMDASVRLVDRGGVGSFWRLVLFLEVPYVGCLTHIIRARGTLM